MYMVYIRYGISFIKCPFRNDLKIYFRFLVFTLLADKLI